MIVLDPNSTEQLIEAHNQADSGIPFHEGGAGKKIPGTSLTSTSISQRQDEYEEARKKMMEEDDDDLFL